MACVAVLVSVTVVVALAASVEAVMPVMSRLAFVAAVVTLTSTDNEPVAPKLAWSIRRPLNLLKFVPAWVMKSKLPSSSLRPWNVTVWAIWFKAFSD